MQIRGRTFIVSGGASGLGLATVRDLHAQGAYTAILDLNATAGAETVSSLGPERAQFFEADMSDSASVASAVDALTAWTAQTGAPVGGVIPAAGVGNPAKLVDRHGDPVPMSAIDFVLDINLRGVIDLLRLTVPLMLKNTPLDPDGERGVIVLVSSSAAFDGQPGQLAYAASKGAVRSMALVLARDHARDGIRCVGIAPSMFDSAMTAAMSDKVRASLQRVFEFPRRAGRAEEFARCVRFCVENAMVNGEVIRLDGATRMPSKM